MNLLYITHHRPHLVHYRAGIFAREMSTRGHQITVVLISQSKRTAWSTRMENGIRYLESPDLLPGKLRSGWDLWDTVSRIHYLKKYWEQADLVHLFETRPVTIYPAIFFQRKHPKPLVIDWNDWWGRGGLITELRPQWYQYLFGGVETWFEEHFRTRADATTLISDGLRPRAHELGVPPTSIFKITGAADSSYFQRVSPTLYRARFNLPVDACIVAYAGLDVNMDLPLLLNAFREARLKNTHLVLVLTGGAKPSTEEDGVVVLGILSKEEFPLALSCADIFALPFPNKPANRGRWPNKVTNYLACGRPVITHPTGEMVSIFKDGKAGLLVEEDPSAMAEAILTLSRDPDLRERMGLHGRYLAETCYSRSEIAQRLQICYKQVLESIPSIS